MSGRYRLTILYPPAPDPAAFREYYLGTHVPIARRMRGLTGWNLSWTDPEDDPRYALVAELYTESKEAMDALLASPEGRAAQDDLDVFAPPGIVFLEGEEDEVALA